MSVNLFPNIDRSKVDKLPFIEGTYPFAYFNHNDKHRLGIVYEVGRKEFEKIESLLKGKIEKKIGHKDRVFVLSGCKVPQFKIKDYCKKVGAIMTGKVTDATIVVGNTSIHQDLYNYEHAPLESKTMIFEMEGFMSQELDSEVLDFDLVLADYYPDFDKIQQFLLTKGAAIVTNASINKLGYYITPYAATVLYEILSRKLPTITDDCLMKQLPSVIKLNREVCEQVCAMMESSDVANQKTAHEILANCDYSNADFYLYKIARQFWNQLRSSRYKNVKLFVKESKIVELCNTTEEGYIQEHFKDNTLTKEELELLLPNIVSDLQRQSQYYQSEIFQLKIEIDPKYEKLLGKRNFNQELKSENDD